jgi:tRNA pseudouridine38-40 synthase
MIINLLSSPFIDHSFDAWIRSTDNYAGNDLLYLNKQGIIPDAAVLKKGEKRSNPFREKKRFDSTQFPKSGGGAATIDDDECDDENPLLAENLADTEG